MHVYKVANHWNTDDRYSTDAVTDTDAVYILVMQNIWVQEIDYKNVYCSLKVTTRMITDQGKQTRQNITTSLLPQHDGRSMNMHQWSTFNNNVGK